MVHVSSTQLTNLLRIGPDFQLITEAKVGPLLATSRSSQLLNRILESASGTLVTTLLVEACLQTSVCLITFDSSIRMPLIHWYEVELKSLFPFHNIQDLSFHSELGRSNNRMVLTKSNILRGKSTLGSCKAMYNLPLNKLVETNEI